MGTSSGVLVSGFAIGSLLASYSLLDSFAGIKVDPFCSPPPHLLDQWTLKEWKVFAIPRHPVFHPTVHTGSQPSSAAAGSLLPHTTLGDRSDARPVSRREDGDDDADKEEEDPFHHDMRDYKFSECFSFRVSQERASDSANSSDDSVKREITFTIDRTSGLVPCRNGFSFEDPGSQVSLVADVSTECKCVTPFLFQH